MGNDNNEESNRNYNKQKERMQEWRDSDAAGRKRMDEINDQLNSVNPGRNSGNNSGGGGGGGKGGGGGGCFIATAAFESADSPELVVLRSFRDRRLMSSVLGRLFVRSYYVVGPSCAAAIAGHPRIKLAIRRILSRFCAHIERSRE